MLSMGSYSKAMIKDYFKRCWILPATSLVMMILLLMMPMILNYRQFNHVAVSAAELVKGGSFMMNFTLVSLAIAASNMMFEYLHNQTSSNVVHSLPLSRTRLFNAAYISGWIMTAAPVIIFAILLMFLRGATSKNAGPATTEFNNLFGSEAMSAKEIFTLPHMFEFIVMSILVASVAYATACLAGVLSGRKGIHGILSVFLFVAPVGIVLLLSLTCEMYLLGFDGFDYDYNYLNVCAFAMAKEGFGIDIMILIYYVVVAVLLSALALWLYKRIKLERVGNSTTFPVAGDILACILAVISTIVFSHIVTIISFDGGSDESIRFALISLISSAVYYALMRMIADSSYKIFNRKNLIQYGVFLTVLAVIIAFTVFDITGFEKRMPSVDQIESVSYQTGFPQSLPQLNGSADNSSDDSELIEDILNLQQAIVKDERMGYGWDDSQSVEVSWDDSQNTEDELGMSEGIISIVWKLKNGREIKRSYEISYIMNEGSYTEYALRNLYDNETYREQIRENMNDIFSKAGKIGINNSESTEYTDIKEEDWADLYHAASKDIESRTFEQMNDISMDDKWLIEIESSEKDDFGGNDFYTYWMNEKHDTGTFKLLKDKGYIK